MHASIRLRPVVPLQGIQLRRHHLGTIRYSNSAPQVMLCCQCRPFMRWMHHSDVSARLGCTTSSVHVDTTEPRRCGPVPEGFGPHHAYMEDVCIHNMPRLEASGGWVSVAVPVTPLRSPARAPQTPPPCLALQGRRSAAGWSRAVCNVDCQGMPAVPAIQDRMQNCKHDGRPADEASSGVLCACTCRLDALPDCRRRLLVHATRSAAAGRES